MNFRKATLLMYLSFGFFSCMGQVENGAFDLLLKTMLRETVPAISVEQLSQKDLDKVVLLDARTKNEYDVSHLKNATWIGYDDFNLSRVKGLDKEQEVVIYCSIGVRSEKIGEKLQEAGFQNVKNLYGSIFEWVNAGNPVYGPDGEPTQKVHAYNRKWGIWLTKGEKVYN